MIIDSLASLLNDPDVAEIIVDGPESVQYVRFGETDSRRAAVRFNDTSVLIDCINELAAAGGQKLSPANPIVSVQLDDGIRLHAIDGTLLKADGPTLTIRKYPLVTV